MSPLADLKTSDTYRPTGDQPRAIAELAEGLRAGDTSGKQLGKWVPDFARGTAWVRKLAEAWYCGQFRVGKFIREYPQHIGPMTDILIGRIFHPDAGRIFDDLDPWLERMKAEGVTS